MEHAAEDGDDDGRCTYGAGCHETEIGEEEGELEAEDGGNVTASKRGR